MRFSFFGSTRLAGESVKRIAFLSAARRLAILAMLAAIGHAMPVLAGGGPENVLLIVNPLSQTLMTIANHYVQLRQIPPANLVFLPWDAKDDTTDVSTFRRKILVPILKAIDERNLTDQIDYVVYSSDFPWGISLDADFRKLTEEMQREAAKQEASHRNPDGKPDGKPGGKPIPKPELPQFLTPVGSLTGLTYLWQSVVAGRPEYLVLQGNMYMRRPIAEQRNVPTTGFHANRRFDQHGRFTTGPGQRYLLSTMLGVTAGRGNTLSEVLDCLKRSASADGTQPKGTIYFVENDDVRSKVRHAIFPTAVRELKQLGVAAEIIDGTLPLGRKDVQGVVMGTSDFDLIASGNVILPGAICDNFTSFGGVMRKDAGQTPLSEFIRFGAAGASGAVTEPYAIADKFPSPMIQVHYARGCTLAEAFYQSIFGPYQLLIVGDPLCRPWAKIPQVTVSGVEPGAVVHGGLSLKPSATLPDGAAVNRFELFLDGVRWMSSLPGGQLSLDTAALADGYHELRVVAIGPPPIESQGRVILPIQVNNHNLKIEASVATLQLLRADQPVRIAVRAPAPRPSY